MTFFAADTFDPEQALVFSADFSERVEALLTSFLAEQHEVISGIAPAAGEIVSAISDLTRGGKRLRPLFAFWGFVGAGGNPNDERIVQAGAALELFQAAALIHDDLIDRSDTRRGQPSIHRRFESLHRASGWHRDAPRFGEAASILTGDLCLSLSEQLFGTISPAVPQSRAIFDRMRVQVMAGQYLDVLEESAGPAYGPADSVKRARTIVRYKSAKYSTENPTLLGGALAGASESLLEQYSHFALPLGEAFQLRDDVLGVFGDPAVTGKPAGDDLREGKRTLLVAYTRETLDERERATLDAAIGDPDLSMEEIAKIQNLMKTSGAFDRVEAKITEFTTEADAALASAPLAPEAIADLRALAVAAVRRSA